MTTEQRLFCKEFLRLDTMPCRHMPLCTSEELARLPTMAMVLRGNHLSNTTCLTQVFFTQVANTLESYGDP